MKWQPTFKKGDIIRHILSGKPLLVIHIFKLGDNSFAALTIDLESRENPTPVTILQQRDFDHWVLDHDMDTKEVEGVIQWSYNHIEL